MTERIDRGATKRTIVRMLVLGDDLAAWALIRHLVEYIKKEDGIDG